jgi:hypothetical protein
MILSNLNELKNIQLCFVCFDVELFDRIWLKWPDSSRKLPDQVISGRIPAVLARYRRRDVVVLRTSAPVGFQRPTIAKLWKSDIKCECKDKEFNFGKRFTVIFRKFNKFLRSNWKWFFFTIIFTPTEQNWCNINDKIANRNIKKIILPFTLH